ncbi:uncharacterized protein HMPREF1541_06818 [Cyphellophora europaea CBS 101466]|uniref:Mitochondrial outer membrane transport complex Sam37/metaxin N-terminal domain-containing protein n=1 Tax=Cyphellophora europaea (strain CBS 101466) TaxID=1220924 RepID=W2RR28_CYPE1|nr:uncharacterized protein HMPREF1541_06818 [Cyphellophora europaea CBS 101466]ETN38780.1 hypothetical protein HMPREF1541_06818 [Cyphellophora europaea CBS 101466]
MTFELHIWGPAFGLPSIDATCLAVVAYCRECVPTGKWTLIPADPSRNPLGQLPALRDGNTWVAGFNDIVDYLEASSGGASHLDKNLSSAESADCAAYASFIQSRGQPLLDLSLYVSTENYTTCTKPALGALLHWPDSWFVPHRLREKARKTSEHLGLSGLDVDSAQDEKQEEGLAAQIPRSLRKPKTTVSSLLGHESRKSKFRLEAVTSDFLEPLNELLGEGPWLVSDNPSSVDCLAIGYLALMQNSGDGAQPWLRDALAKKFPGLAEWTQKTRREWFGETVTPSMARQGQTDKHVLPWQQLSDPSPQQIANSLALNITEALPVLKSYLTPTGVKTHIGYDEVPKHERKQLSISRVRSSQLLYSQALVSGMSAVILTSVLLYNGILRVPDLRRTPTPQRGFGTAGEFLGLR